MPYCLLVDNGSVKPAATKGLRAVAARLEKAIGDPVAPVSLQHSGKVDPEKLGAQPAELFLPALDTRLRSGITDFVVVPLFFGPSLAVVRHVPGKIHALKERYPQLNVRLADPLSGGDSEDDDRLARILTDRIDEVREATEQPAVVVVDHGSPSEGVTRVRNRVAEQVGGLLKATVARVAAASMERRPGAEFAFNEPLLEDLLVRDGYNRGKVIAAMMFLFPARHAGPGGDIEKICRAAERRQPGLEVVPTDLVGDHPGLIPILADRFRGATATEPV